ncbi:hypothetical protein GAPWKB11_1298 [Gilliamella apicola]|nr:hypothetical protein [Gilliamella apicola]KFA58680.1 hypothetical protein GAPWKB11_1298 [Gilliamella apicola]
MDIIQQRARQLFFLTSFALLNNYLLFLKEKAKTTLIWFHLCIGKKTLLSRCYHAVWKTDKFSNLHQQQLQQRYRQKNIVVAKQPLLFYRLLRYLPLIMIDLLKKNIEVNTLQSLLNQSTKNDISAQTTFFDSIQYSAQYQHKKIPIMNNHIAFHT